MKRLGIWLLVGALLMMCCACGEEEPQPSAVDTKDGYSFTATLEEYPDVLISAKSLEALNEVVAALASETTASPTLSTTAVTTTTAVVTTTDTTASTIPTTLSPVVPTTPPTAATQSQSPSSPTLNETEQRIFDFLTNTLYRFTNPASVKAVKFYGYQANGERYFLSLTSMTDKGGYETKLYTLDESGSYGSIFSEFQIRTQAELIGITTPACDIAALNRALDNYYVSQGWK